jgi:hypothetical protein
MEIKILCTCGTKFKFDVEPVNGRMPSPVFCPACGADTTAQANTLIQAAPGAAQAIPVVAPAPAPSAAPAPAGPPGLRINRPAAHSAPPAASTGENKPPAAPLARPHPLPSSPKATNPIVKVLSTIVTVALIAFGGWHFGSKWYRRLSVVAQVASAAGEASVDKNESSEGAKNLWYEKCAMLFVQHSNHLEVAKACQDYWKTNFHKNLLLVNAEGDYFNPGEYELIPAHNGYVRIIGAHEWPIPAHEGLAKSLSQTFGGLVFEWREETFADTFHFGVFEQGVKKFHAQMDVQITGDDSKEIYKTEGNDYVLATGFKPGANGFAKFDEGDADRVTQKLGLKIWDEKEGSPVKAILLRENPPPVRSN